MSYEEDNDIFDSSERSESSSREHREYNFKAGQSGNPKGRPKGTISSANIKEEDREYFGTDSKKFLERALYKARTWEEGLRYAKELRLLQHPSLQSIQTRTDNVHTLTLRWSRPDELPSNQTIELEHSEGNSNEQEHSEERQSK